ncbi:hypothetical protein PoB_002495300 [Plakobranchus ocellatus]|uniref:Uncharacterized protein n=1 Tax=Plakobranchus ocellatus TaxID=259542 RepID=A0AAV3ZU90_9GAST|nr:hypothetical protein PoB_002495300 [Plakobranchus ocellatus]
MPPKKPSPAKGPSKAPAKTTVASKAPAKTGSVPAKQGATAAKAPAATPKKEPEPAPKPVVVTDVPFKQVDAMVVYDKEGTVKATGKWAIVMDENSLIGRFLRHRDVNMLTAPDNADMQPEVIRKALLGSVKYGKPFVIDMMETDMYEFLVERFDEILPGLFEMVIDKSIIKDESYMKIVKDSDGPEFHSKYDYNIDDFSFLIITSCMAPKETILRKMYPVKVVN